MSISTSEYLAAAAMGIGALYVAVALPPVMPGLSPSYERAMAFAVGGAVAAMGPPALFWVHDAVSEKLA